MVAPVGTAVRPCGCRCENICVTQNLDRWSRHKPRAPYMEALLDRVSRCVTQRRNSGNSNRVTCQVSRPACAGAARRCSSVGSGRWEAQNQRRAQSGNSVPTGSPSAGTKQLRWERAQSRPTKLPGLPSAAITAPVDPHVCRTCGSSIGGRSLGRPRSRPVLRHSRTVSALSIPPNRLAPSERMNR